MTEEHFPAAPHAPFSVVAISALLWSQGGIWAALGVVPLFLPAQVPAGDLITAVLFGFAALSWVLAVLLPRRGGERARIWVIAQETFITFLGLAIFGTWVFALDGYYLMAPIGLSSRLASSCRSALPPACCLAPRATTATSAPRFNDRCHSPESCRADEHGASPARPS